MAGKRIRALVETTVANNGDSLPIDGDSFAEVKKITKENFLKETAEAIDIKQNKENNNDFNTTAKDVSGAINELDSGKVDKVTGKSLVADAAITDLTDGGDTVLHIHDTRYYTETEIDALNYTKTEIDALNYTKTEIDALNYTKSELASTTNGKGASLVGVEDAGNYYTGTEVETALQEVGADYANKFYDNAGAHNSIYRGKYLGATLTTTQQTTISSGTFEDLYIGDYWTIGGVNYRVAGFNYFRNVGDTALTANHLTIVTDTVLYNARMNELNITTGGYVDSEMRTTNLASAITIIETAFPGRVIQHRQILVNATSSGKASGWAWYDSKAELMNEVMLYGTVAWGESTYNSGYNVSTGNGRLPLFAHRQDMVNTRQSYWLRDVVSATYFANASASGAANHYNASRAFGVRPAFSIF